MDVIQIAITAAITALVSGLVAAVVSSVVAKGGQLHEREEAQQEIIKCLAVDKVTYLTQKSVNEGEITIKQRSFIHDLARAARVLGANGETEECDRIVDEIPTKHV